MVKKGTCEIQEYFCGEQEVQPFPHPADEHRDIRPLPAAIRMQLVQHQKAQPLGVRDDLRIGKVRPRHDEFQHDVIGEQDVRRVFGNLLALVRAFLARVAGVRDRFLPHAIAIGEKFLEFLQLAIAQRIHRIDDDRADARAGVALTAAVAGHRGRWG